MLKVIKCRDLLFIISREEPQAEEKEEEPFLDDFDHAFLDEFGGPPEQKARLARIIVECKRKHQEYLKENQDKLQKLKKMYPGMSQNDPEEFILIPIEPDPEVSLFEDMD